MILRTGIDLIEIGRIQAAWARHGERFLKRLFTPVEVEACAGRAESLAARFAAKEAVAKALGTGIGPVGWLEIEIAGHEFEAPRVQLHGRAARQARQLGLTCWSVSLTHSREMAVAVVVAWGEESGAIG
jgi:holo-[acyl-carrier protein] synthase